VRFDAAEVVMQMELDRPLSSCSENSELPGDEITVEDSRASAVASAHQSSNLHK